MKPFQEALQLTLKMLINWEKTSRKAEPIKNMFKKCINLDRIFT